MAGARNQSAVTGELDQRQTSPALNPVDISAFVATPSVTENTTQTLGARRTKPDSAAN